MRQNHILTLVLFVVMGLLIFTPHINGATYRVGHGSGYDYNTITVALNNATSGDVIQVADGNYTTATGEVFPLELNEGVALVSEISDSLPHVIGDMNDSVLKISSTDTYDTKVDGLWISSGGGDRAYAGGIYLLDANATIINCRITDNHNRHPQSSVGVGGAIKIYQKAPRIMNCEIIKNTSYIGSSAINCRNARPQIIDSIINENLGIQSSGCAINCKNSGLNLISSVISNNISISNGGIQIDDSDSVYIYGCNIFNNQAQNRDGGGISIYNSKVTIDRTLINGNIAREGAGIFLKGSSSFLKLTNSIISNNWANSTGYQHGGGISGEHAQIEISNCTFYGNTSSAGGGIHLRHCNPSITNSIFWNDSPDEVYIYPYRQSMSYCNVEGGAGPGIGNIFCNPDFVAAHSRDFRLSPGSCCVDTGTNNSVTIEDYNGSLRPNPDTGKVDIGALEYYGPTATPAPTATATPTHPAQPITIRVAQYSPADYTSITAALKYAQAGDTILVESASYSWLTGEQYPIALKEGVKIAAENTYLKPILDSKWYDSVILADQVKDFNTIIDSFIIRGGGGHWEAGSRFGGGVYCNDSNITFRNCEIRENMADKGGGFYCIDSSIRFSNCEFYFNDAPRGAGIFSDFHNNFYFVECKIMINRGIGAWLSGDVVMINCMVYDNYHQGLLLSQGMAHLINCSVFDNSLTVEYGVQAGVVCVNNMSSLMNCLLYDNGGAGVASPQSADTRITNCIVRANAPIQIYAPTGPVTVTYSNVEDGFYGTGNIDLDPEFESAVNRNFHLESNSPCIDAGTNTGAPDFDYDGNPRPNPNTSITDIGPDEYYGVPPTTNTPIATRTPYRTSTPTATSSPYPTYLPTNTPDYSPTPTPTPTPTDTATPLPPPVIQLAGYMDSLLEHPIGVMNILALAPRAQQVEIFYEGVGLGVYLNQVGAPDDGVFTLHQAMAISDPTHLMALLELQASNGRFISHMWPYFMVEP